MDENKELWQRAAAFHGHVCGGLTIGYKASLYAIELLGIGMEDGVCSKDEEIVCITENDACGVDAIQAILGCTVGKGNLLFHIRGKQAFSFYTRKNGRSARLVLRPAPAGMSREESFAYYQAKEPEELFDVIPAVLAVPERARLFDSVVCESCGEVTGANWVRVAGGKHYCLDCYPAYDRFNV